MPANSGTSNSGTSSGTSMLSNWICKARRWLSLEPQRAPRSGGGLQVMTLEDRRLLAGDVTSVDVISPSDDLVTEENLGAGQFVVEVNFDTTMQADNFSGDPGAAGPRLLFSNSGRRAARSG